MLESNESLRSRRAYIKTAIAGAAGTLMAGIDKHAAHAYTGAQQRRQGSNVSQLSLSEASQLVRSKKVSPVELTRECLSRIERLNPKLNAFITVTADSALAEDRQAEAEIQHERWRGPLHGIPIGLKDLIDIAGVRTTAASGLFKDRVPAQDAEIVHRLKAAGAVLLGKLNLHEFAYGGSSVISHFGPVHNPWNLDYSPGGSSGGSAAAVAAQLCYGAIGSDTGGSIRQPAGYCGIVGLKPTYGRVSTFGVIPLAWSLDHLGPITRTATDAALIVQVIAGYDAQDVASIDIPVPDYAATIAAATSSLRLGILRAYFYEAVGLLVVLVCMMLILAALIMDLPDAISVFVWISMVQIVAVFISTRRTVGAYLFQSVFFVFLVVVYALDDSYIAVKICYLRLT